jgi:hypothetical protein
VGEGERYERRWGWRVEEEVESVMRWVGRSERYDVSGYRMPLAVLTILCQHSSVTL